MNNQKQILSKQNDPEMLDCQYASRVLFNRAEKNSYRALVCIALSAFSVFLTGEIISLFMPLIVDFLILFFVYCTHKSQSEAAKLRNYFDANVLGIKEKDYSETEIRNINSVIYDIVNNNIAERDTQIRNTGRDTPPGVKDWYEFNNEHFSDEAVFECQRQNCWWNNELCKRRIRITITLFIVTSSIYWLTVYLLHAEILRSIVCFVGAIMGFVEQCFVNCKYIKTSKTMDDLIELPDISHNPTQIEYLQGLINSRRELPVLEMNWLHKKNAKKWSEKYEQISNN